MYESAKLIRTEKLKLRIISRLNNILILLQNVTFIYTTPQHLNPDIRKLNIWKTLALDRNVVDTADITLCFTTIGEPLRMYYEYFNILTGAQKSFRGHQRARGYTACGPWLVGTSPIT
jgi:hypothetical protein